MKIVYEKYDESIRAHFDDTVPGWEPLDEDIVVEVGADELLLTTYYSDGTVTNLTMTIIENAGGRIIAQHLDAIMGVTIFAQCPKESREATLTLVSYNYIVGRYLRQKEPADGS